MQLRPVLMAALAAAIGLLPAAMATGIGSETQRPLARVVVGGMMTSALMILFALPVVYLLTHRQLEMRAKRVAMLSIVIIPSLCIFIHLQTSSVNSKLPGWTRNNEKSARENA